MLNFINDAWQLLRMRFKPLDEYRYPPVVMVAILLVLAVGEAQGFMPVLGLDQYRTVGVAFVFVVMNWLVFSQTMKVFLHYYGAPKLPLAPFVLLSQSLAIPAMLFVFLPPSIALSVVVAWKFWCVWVRVNALSRGSDVSPLHVLLGHLACFVTMILASALLLTILISMGVLDLELMMANINELQQQMAP